MRFNRDDLRAKRNRLKAKPGVEDLEGRKLLAVQIVGNTQVFDHAGKITLKLERSATPAGLKKTDTVAVDTLDKTAIAGTDYVAIHQVITFKPGIRTKTVTIPIFPDGPNTATKTFALTLDHAPFPTNGSNSQAAIVSIVHKAPAQAKHQSPPKIKQTLLLTSGDQVNAFVITFDKAMARGPVENLSNYVLRNLQDSSEVKLRWAVYNSARHEVTLVPLQSVPVATYVVENPGPDLHSKITDVKGVALDGVGDGRPNGIFYATFSPHGPTPSPIVKARLVSDMRVHAAKDARRKDQLGGSLGGLGALLLL